MEPVRRPGPRPEARERRVEAIVDSFASALGWGERNNRALTLTTQATAALIELAAVLPDGLQPTIFQIPWIFGNPEWLAVALPFLSRRAGGSSPSASPGSRKRRPPLSRTSSTGCAHPRSWPRCSARRDAYDIARAMNERRIILACPGAGGARDRLVANLLVFDLLHPAKGRADMPPEKRLPFYVVLDEVQTYDGAANGNLAALLEQVGKYEVKATLLNQNPERLTSDTLNASTTNRSHLITTALNAHAAGLIAREWGGDPPASAIIGLPRRTFIAQVTHNGKLTRPFLFGNESVERLSPGRFTQTLSLRSSQRSTPRREGPRPLRPSVRSTSSMNESASTSKATGARAASPGRTPTGRGQRPRPNDEIGGAAMSPRVAGDRPLPAVATEVLCGLYQHRTLSTTQLHALYTPQARRAVDATGTQSCSPSAGWWTRAQGPGTLSLWFLTEYGAETVETAGPRAEPRRRLVGPAQAEGPLRKHTLRVNDVGVAFVRAARERGDECGPESWRHEIAHPISPARGRRPAELAVADALLTYLQTGEDGSLALHQRFIELDRGTARPAEQLAAKITRYTRLRYYTPSRPGQRMRQPSRCGATITAPGRTC